VSDYPCGDGVGILRSEDCLSSIVRGLQDKQRDHMLHLYLKSMLIEGCHQFMELLMMMMTQLFLKQWIQTPFLHR
jgi:hypothetical protein